MSDQFYNYLIKLNEYDRKVQLGVSLAINLVDFKRRWRKYAKEFQFEYKDLMIESEGNILQVKLQGNDNIVFFGDIITYNEEKILRNITMIASGDGSPQSGANIFLAIGVLIACLNPNENVEFRRKIFEELDVSKLEIGYKQTVMIDDFLYAISLTKEMGTMFSVSRNN